MDVHALMASAELISFDFFDTLFFRHVKVPESVFDLVGEKHGIPGFRQMRVAAQQKAFRRMVERKKNEISLRDIYECFPETAVSVKVLMEDEYCLELSLLSLNPEVAEWLQAALANGKRVVITSDMYLPRDFFERALSEHGLAKLPLYVSADCNATKRDAGELFEVLATEQAVDYKNILHIGDNPIGDVQRAQEKGINAYHYIPPVRRVLDTSATLASSVAHGLLQSGAQAGIGIGSLEEFGYLYGGPAMVGFLEWIKEQSRAGEFDHILFLARDGFLLDKIARKHSSDGFPDFLYFMGSRTAFSLAAITDETFEKNIPFLLSGSIGLSPIELLERIGVRPPARGFLEKFGFHDESLITDALQTKIVQFIKAYRWEILRVCQRNRRALYQYLHRNNIKDGSRIALVDVGWRGTSQEAFEKAVRPFMHLDVTGLYFCLADSPETRLRKSRQRMVAMIGPEKFGKHTIAQIYEKRLAIEMCFSAPHHSIIGLRPGAHETEPVYDPGRGDTSETTKQVCQILQGVEKFAADFYEMRRRTLIEISPSLLVQAMVDYVVNAEEDYSHIIEKVKNFDAWGSSKNLMLTLKSYAT